MAKRPSGPKRPTHRKSAPDTKSGPKPKPKPGPKEDAKEDAKAVPVARDVAPPAPAPQGTSGITAAEALSFLKETKGEVSWTAREMAATLRLSAKEAAQVLAVLQMQGYVRTAEAARAAQSAEWITTPEGEAVAGAKAPRFTRTSVEKALAELQERMAALNRDAKAEFQVGGAVAFGDFLSGRAQVQAADVGVELTRRDPEGQDVNSVVEQILRREVLRTLRARSAMVNLRPHEKWMSHRSHRKLM